MIRYSIRLNGGKNVWRIRQTRDMHHCERLWREGKYVGPKKVNLKSSRNGINPARFWVA